jgi:transcriptional regulator with XRE-family HTH domain
VRRSDPAHIDIHKDLFMPEIEQRVETSKDDAERLRELIARVDHRRRQLGLSERATAVKAGLSPSQIRTMRRQLLEGKQRGISIRTVAHLANVLGTTPEWLISGSGGKEGVELRRCGRPLGGLRLAGVVGAGVWVEAGSDDDAAHFVTVPSDPRYPAEYQSAYEVRGTSTDRFARPGDFLIVVDRKAAGLPLRSGDITLVSQIKGDLREVTARRFQRSAPNCELRFESTDVRYGGPPLLVRDLEETSTILGGMVVGVYRPL